ncbi:MULTISPECIES: hypothetical protein [Curtobacterium]|uniref:hypothetical protein n=1 Tax=Curtobacterium flaccumfaciens TaxID=2035 RepID=UPI003EE4550A
MTVREWQVTLRAGRASEPVRRAPSRAERGSVTVLLAVVLGVGAILATAGIAAATHRVAVVRVQGASDAAALAAAAALVGLLPGDPCARAAAVASAGGAALDGCSTAGSRARVTATIGSGAFAVSAVAVAGAPSGADHLCVYGVHVGPRSPMSRSTRTASRTGDLAGPGPTSTIDQGDTCQARRSS